MNNKIIALMILTCSANALAGQDAVSNSDLSRKLDLILLKVDSLETRVNAIEGKSPKPMLQTVPPVKVGRTAPISLDSNLQKQPAPATDATEEKKSFFQKIKKELKIEQAQAAGHWTKPESWRSIRNNVSSFQVRSALGNPTKIKNSLNPRIERVYRYEGDLDGDGVKEKGVVNFHRDRVVSFESPFHER
jgi:hypothetical protein